MEAAEGAGVAATAGVAVKAGAGVGIGVEVGVGLGSKIGTGVGIAAWAGKGVIQEAGIAARPEGCDEGSSNTSCSSRGKPRSSSRGRGVWHEHHLLVAPMTTTAPRSSTPSMRASRVATTEAKTWSLLLLLLARAGTRPSSSSRKMMEGAFLAACGHMYFQADHCRLRRSCLFVYIDQGCAGKGEPCAGRHQHLLS